MWRGVQRCGGLRRVEEDGDGVWRGVEGCGEVWGVGEDGEGCGHWDSSDSTPIPTGTPQSITGSTCTGCARSATPSTILHTPPRLQHPPQPPNVKLWPRSPWL